MGPTPVPSVGILYNRALPAKQYLVHSERLINFLRCSLTFVQPGPRWRVIPCPWATVDKYYQGLYTTVRDRSNSCGCDTRHAAPYFRYSFEQRSWAVIMYLAHRMNAMDL